MGMKQEPLVSIICLSYNHERFVAECLQSVFVQTYPALELIVVDDFSKDRSVAIIESLLRPQDKFIQNCDNQGVCQSFNRGLAQAKGKYIVDLAADDLLFPDTIAKQVAYFETLSEEYGAIFGDAVLISETGKKLGTWYKRNAQGKRLQPVPSGDVFAAVLAGTPILTVTAMTRRSVYEALDGYDESLLYEDFDFLVRASRRWKYGFNDECWVKYRQVKGSHSKQQQLRRTQQMESTWKVCEKAAVLVQTPEEITALLIRLRNGLRQCFFLEHYALGAQYAALYRKFKPLPSSLQAIAWACQLKIPFYQVYRTYQKLRR